MTLILGLASTTKVSEIKAKKQAAPDNAFIAALQKEQQVQAKNSPKAIQKLSSAEQVEQRREAARNTRDEFMKYMDMSPEERLRAQILAELGVTEEEVEKMSLEDRKKLEAKIEQHIKRKLGVDADQGVSESAESALSNPLG